MSFPVFGGGSGGNGLSNLADTMKAANESLRKAADANGGNATGGGPGHVAKWISKALAREISKALADVGKILSEAAIKAGLEAKKGWQSAVSSANAAFSSANKTIGGAADAVSKVGKGLGF